MRSFIFLFSFNLPDSPPSCSLVSNLPFSSLMFQSSLFHLPHLLSSSLHFLLLYFIYSLFLPLFFCLDKCVGKVIKMLLSLFFLLPLLLSLSLLPFSSSLFPQFSLPSHTFALSLFISNSITLSQFFFYFSALATLYHSGFVLSHKASPLNQELWYVL